MIANRGHIVASVNSWRDDHADDPLLAVMSAIDGALRPMIADDEAIQTAWKSIRRVGGKVAVAALKGVLIQGVTKVVGAAGIDEIVQRAASAATER